MSGCCDLTTTETVYLQVDQPAGTGLSYTSTDKYVHELTEVGRA
jgi:hypothetical protein